MKIEDACPTCGALCEVDLGNEEGEYVAIGHVDSATPADQEPIYQVSRLEQGWFDVSERIYEMAPFRSRRIVYAQPPRNAAGAEQS